MHTSQTRVRNIIMGVFAVLPALHAQAQYSIIDLGVLVSGESAQANGISPNGTYAAGRELGPTYRAVEWSNGGSPKSLTNLPGRNYANAYAVNNSGVAVGSSTTTTFGSGALPVIWTGGVGAQLPLPSGQTVGRAYAVNGANTAAGSVGSGTTEVATLWSGGSTGNVSYITAKLADGSYMTTAYGLNNAGLVVGNGINPNNAAVNVGLVYNSATGTMTSVGALAGANGALAFGVSDAGYVVGSSMFNQGSGQPYVWSATGGIVSIPLPSNTSTGSARAVNDFGLAVGTAGGAYAVPFLFSNGTTYSLADLIPANTGWDLNHNTSSSALGITDSGLIVGTGVYNGSVHAFEMVPTQVPEPGTWALLLTAGLGAGALARARGPRRNA